MPWKPKKSILAMGAMRVEHVLHEHGAPEILPGAIRDVIRNAMEDGTDMAHVASPISIEGTLPHWVGILEKNCGITAVDIKLAKKLDQRPHVKRWLLRFGHKRWPSSRIRLYEVLAELLAAETPLITRDQQIDPQLVPRMLDTYSAWETEVRRKPSIIRRSNAKGYDREDPNQRYDGESTDRLSVDGKDPIRFDDENTKPWLMPARIVSWPDRKHVISFDDLMKAWKAEWKQLHKEAKARMIHDWKIARAQAIKDKVPKSQLPPKPHLGYPRGKYFPFFVKKDLMDWLTHEQPVLGKVLRPMDRDTARDKAKAECLEIIEAMNGAAHGDKRAEFKLRSKRRRWFGKIGADLDESKLWRYLRIGSVEVEDDGEIIKLPIWERRRWHELERFKLQLRRKMENDVRTPKGMAWFPKASIPVETQYLIDELVLRVMAEKGRTPNFNEIPCEERVTNPDGTTETLTYYVADVRWAIEAYYDIRLDPDLEHECEERGQDPRCPKCHGVSKGRPRTRKLKLSPESPNVTVHRGPKKAPKLTCGYMRWVRQSEGEIGAEHPGCQLERKAGHAYCHEHMQVEPASLWPWA